MRKDLSVVIPTRNGCAGLRSLLQSILSQTELPKEVFVVDDSDGEETRTRVEFQKEVFSGRGVQLEHLRGNQEARSISAARNAGAERASGDVVCFLDDDVVLDRNYLKEIAYVFETRTNAKGVQGHIVNYRAHSGFDNALNRVCCGFPRRYFEPNRCQAFPMGYPQPLTEVIECQWCIGACSSYQRKLLKDFRFDENLIGYSLCEDLDLSMRILRHYPRSLFITPKAKLIHRGSIGTRIPKEEFFPILVRYTTYLFYKNVAQNLRSNITFYWGSFIGRFVLRFAYRDAGGLLLLGKAVLETLKDFNSVRLRASFRLKEE